MGGGVKKWLGVVGKGKEDGCRWVWNGGYYIHK